MKELEIYKEMLLERSRYVNLTAIRDPNEAELRHFADSLEVARAVRLSGMKIIDVGTGAGFPGLPLRIRDPSIKLTLLEATGKKVAFLRDVCDALRLDDVKCINGRAEEEAHKPGLREKYDFAVSRGVANLRALAELCLPFCKAGGVFLAMKEAQSGIAELEKAGHAIARLGGIPMEPYFYNLGENRRHVILKIKKISPTPKEYPRRWAVIKSDLL